MRLSGNGRSGNTRGSDAGSVRPCTGWGASPAAIPTCLSCGGRGGGRGGGGGRRGGGGAPPPFLEGGGVSRRVLRGRRGASPLRYSTHVVGRGRDGAATAQTAAVLTARATGE